MGNSQTCVDCKTPVPKKVKWLDNIGGDWGQRFCKWTGNETWIKLGSDKYLCSPCLVKRQNQERQRQQEEERKKENERQEEKRRQDEKRQEEERRQEEMRREERRRQEERRQEERRQEEMRREEERRQEEMRKEEERRQEGMRKEEERRQEKCRQEEMRREEKQQEDRRQNERRQEEEVVQEQRKQEESLKQYEEQRQVMETHKGAEQRQSEDFEFERQDEKKNIKEGTDQLLLSEKRLSNWKRREKETSNETEHSQIIKESLSKRPNNDFNISSSPKYTSNPIHELSNYVLEQKDDRSVLQEMLDKGNFSEAQRVTISNVLLAVQENINSYENQDMFHRMRRSPDHQLLRKLCFKKSDFTDNEKEFPDCIFEICLAVKLTKKYWPRNTQITALCLLVKAIQKGILLEINTGEGKTCIVAMFSAFLGLSQTAVDIVSSSSILAQRDFVEWKTFYKLLNVSVSCNLTIKKTEERLKCYSNDVVYGTVGSFASDLLRQTFLMENVRGERKCEAVIVDEVDCLLLDQGIHFTYLSHVVPGMHHIEPILFMIWKHIVKHDKIVSDNSEHFFLGVLDSMHVVLSSYIDLSELCKKPNIPPDIQWLCLLEGNNLLKNGFTKDAFKENKSQYKKVFTIEKILECLEFIEKNFNVPLRFQPYIISNDTTVEAINPTGLSNDHIIHLLVVGEGLLCVLHPYEDEKDIHNFVKEEVKGYISFDGLKPSKHYIPSYLEEFVDNRLLHWIENAFTAKHMINGREYLVKDNDVLPVDFESTGVVQFDTKWGDCLHQFLEIKHGKKLSQITLVTNFMSNHEYFNRYQGKIFGVSGTLGTEKDSSFLMRQFSLSCLKIPTHRSNVFNELPGIICSSKHEWITKIQNIVLNQVARTSNKGQRAVLVICEDINTANEMKNRLTGTDCSSVSLYTRNDENNDKINDKLKAGDVIVATNIAGRGTDVDIDESVEKAGGLFVLVTFLPQNTRIQNQVFGRSARKGQPGSAQIVIFFNRNSLPSYFSLHQFTDTTIMTIESARRNRGKTNSRT